MIRTSPDSRKLFSNLKSKQFDKHRGNSSDFQDDPNKDSKFLHQVLQSQNFCFCGTSKRNSDAFKQTLTAPTVQ